MRMANMARLARRPQKHPIPGRTGSWKQSRILAVFSQHSRRLTGASLSGR